MTDRKDNENEKITDTEELLSLQPCIIKFEEFEGPLDLLLHLVKEKKRDILTISVASIVDDYIRYLDLMRSLNIDIASEYLKMAATLIHLKSKALVYESLTDEEEQSPEEKNIIERILIYRRFRDAGHELSLRKMLMRDIFIRRDIRELSELIPDEVPIENVDIITLIKLYREICDRSNRDYSYELTPERVSVLSRIYELIEIFKERENIRFLDMFSRHETKIDIIVTFLAILEMARLRFIKLVQMQNDELYISANLGEGIMDETIFRSENMEYK
ncbi:MAG: segregation/condensation protein A [Deltaproteobacteria bacterium]|nr:segregation/condensation protein A [Deltaproteobacteria bacterium]